MPYCSHPPHCSCHQRRLANCYWMPAPYTGRQTSYPRRHPTCWASSHRSHTVSSTSCHGVWTSAPLSTHLFTRWECTASQIETLIPAAQELISSSDDNNRNVMLWVDHQWYVEWLQSTVRLRTFISDIGPTFLEWSFQEQRGFGLNRFCTGVSVATSLLELRWMCDSLRMGCAQRITPIYKWHEQAVI